MPLMRLIVPFLSHLACKSYLSGNDIVLYNLCNCSVVYCSIYLLMASVDPGFCLTCLSTNTPSAFASSSSAREERLIMTTVARGYETLFKVDLTKPWGQQQMLGHNRWHPDIPPVSTGKSQRDCRYPECLLLSLSTDRNIPARSGTHEVYCFMPDSGFNRQLKEKIGHLY